MTDTTADETNEMEERRQQSGTWLCFVLNIILFPAPTHFTILRIKNFHFAKSVKHLGLTLFLVIILLLSAILQLIYPGIGRFWMLLPIVSGCWVLFANRSIKKNFNSFDMGVVTHTHLHFFLIFLFLFTLLTVLPDLDFIELNQQSPNTTNLWLTTVPFWQDLVILIMGVAVLLAGYLTNTKSSISINRAFILYACFITLYFLLATALVLSFNWLKVKGGLGTHILLALISAMLALDYWDARAFGQYVRRFFFLTCTKGLYFLFLWLCFLGLPQKTASTIVVHYFKKSRPAVVQGFDAHLVFSHRDRFRSAHNASHRLRYLYTRAILNARTDELNQINRRLYKNNEAVFPADADIYSLKKLIDSGKVKNPVSLFEKIPKFRPIHPEWDVMLTALLMQNTISMKDLNDFIVDFKSILPKMSEGHLPPINTPNKARYVSLATNTHVDFIPPKFEVIEVLLKNNLYPVLYIHLAGSQYWATLINMDPQSGIAWFRIETKSDMGQSIQNLYDSDESKELEDEITSRIMVPLSLKYFRDHMEQYPGPVVVFTKKGLGKTLPNLFSGKELDATNRAITLSADPESSTTPLVSELQPDTLSDYAGYLRRVASVKNMLSPTPYKRNRFFRPATPSLDLTGVDRLKKIDDLIGQIPNLVGRDRIKIAALLAANNHARIAPHLFKRMATEKTVSSDHMGCRDAFLIGRELFLLGYHQKAYRYLELPFLRHPFNSKYELWYHIVREKLTLPPIPFYSPPYHQPDLYLYYQTLVDLRKGHNKRALKRLEDVIEKDSLNSLATHLLSKYFNRPLDDHHFFPTQEGL
ncbi:MAG: hypothetical protein GY699_02285 [Desulfobacteraceae bacterium]|nr:hypothetical protein [Desulfobacteraceae bacterium]